MGSHSPRERGSWLRGRRPTPGCSIWRENVRSPRWRARRPGADLASGGVAVLLARQQGVPGACGARGSGGSRRSSGGARPEFRRASGPVGTRTPDPTPHVEERWSARSRRRRGRGAQGRAEPRRHIPLRGERERRQHGADYDHGGKGHDDRAGRVGGEQGAPCPQRSYSAAVDVRAGEIAVGSSGTVRAGAPSHCAEGNVCNALGGDANSVIFTHSYTNVRQADGSYQVDLKPVCVKCQADCPESRFVDGIQGAPDGPWGR